MLKLVKILISSIGFLQIVFAPTLIGALIGFIIYNAKTDIIGLTIAIIVTSLGLIAGIIWAVCVAKRQDPADYVSPIRANSDIDNN